MMFKERKVVNVAKTILIFIVLFVVLLMSSCSKVVYRDIEKTTVDTMFIQKVDSFVNTIYKEKIKEVLVKDSSVTIVDDSGKVRQREIWHTEYVNVENKDSMNYYKSRCDSLSKVSNSTEKNSEVVVKEKTDRWHTLKQVLFTILVISFTYLSFRYVWKN